MNIEGLIKIAAYLIFLITLSYCISLFTAYLPSGLLGFVWFLDYLMNCFLVAQQIKFLDRKEYLTSLQIGAFAVLSCIGGMYLLLLEIGRILGSVE